MNTPPVAAGVRPPYMACAKESQRALTSVATDGGVAGGVSQR
jgi:hypothetical protein